MRTKGQSAIEFLTAYSTAFLIIAIILAALFAFVSLPFTSLPFSCNPYSDFTCQDALISSNGTGGTVLLVELSDGVPGALNISAFNATLNGIKSKKGYCAPTLATSGERLYCITTFKGEPQLGALYSGTFDIYADFCTGGAADLTLNCSSGSTYVYGGNIRLQGSSNVSSASVWEAQITLTNNQGTAAPPDFQQMITFNPMSANAPSHERQNLGNIRFYYGSQELYAWCESNCSASSAQNATFWVKIPQGIPARHSTTIQMYLMPTSIDYSGTYEGEAPQISSPYGAYDNGDEVFAFYQNFQGTSIPYGWTESGSGISVSVDNGITVSPAGSSASGNLTSSVRYNGTLDFYGGFSGSGSCPYNTAHLGYDNASVGYSGCPNGFSLITNNSLGGAALSDSAYSGSSNAIFTVTYDSAGAYNALVGYGSPVSSNSFISKLPLPIAFYQQSGSGVTISAAWIRVRETPPDGAMPSQTVGALSQLR